MRTCTRLFFHKLCCTVLSERIQKSGPLSRKHCSSPHLYLTHDYICGKAQRRFDKADGISKKAFKFYFILTVAGRHRSSWINCLAVWLCHFRYLKFTQVYNYNLCVHVIRCKWWSRSVMESPWEDTLILHAAQRFWKKKKSSSCFLIKCQGGGKSI